MGGGCRRCGGRSQTGARFCATCGSALLAPAAGVRKTVTVLFTDVVGLTGLTAERDPEDARRTASELYATLRAVLQEHGGTVEKYAGDAVMAVFGVPVAHEDDALRAATAALALGERTAALLERVHERTGHRLALRSALNTGEVLSERDGDEGLVLGEAVVVAARLLQHCGPDEVLVGPDTAQLLRTTVVTGEPRALLLRGRETAVRAHPLTGIRPGAAPHRRTELVGRDADRTLLAASLDRVVRSRTAQLVTVLGEAGVGKSRLVEEFLGAAASSGVFVRRVRCRSYGARVRWSPLPALLDGLPVDALPEDAQRVLAALLGEGTAPRATDVAWALALEAQWLSDQAPCVIVLEDLHGAEPEALEVVQEVVRRLDGSPVLVVATARPSLHDAAPTWGAGLRQSMSLRLAPLGTATTRRLAESLLAPGDAPADLLDRVVEAAGGNPLFVEQVLSMLVESGRLARGDDAQWRLEGDAAALELPPTVAALLAARLDQLPAAERHALERGALLGKEFSADELAGLVDDALRDELPALLSSLVRRELLRGTGGSRSFPSSLVRKAAYAGLPRAERARLHEQVGRALAARPGQDELAGGHLESAVRHREEIGVPDPALREAAADLLARAGTRALTGDAVAAQALLTRATALMAVERRLLTVPDLARVQALTGDLAGAEVLLRDALREARELGHDVAAAHARLALVDLLRSTTPEALDDAEELVAEVVPLLRVAGDDRGLSLAWQLQAGVHQYHVRWAAMEDPLEKALVHAHRAGDARLAELAQSLLVGSLFHGPTHATEVRRRLLHMVATPGISRSHRASVAARLAATRALQGEVDEAVARLDEVREVFLSLGRPLSAAATAFMRGPVLMLADDPSAAAWALDDACQVLDAMGDRAYASTLRALLAEARWRCDDRAGAQSAVDACRRTAAGGDVITQLRWRAVQAKLCAVAGDAEQALSLADAAVRLAARTDEVVSQGDVLCDRAEVRAGLGDPDGAQSDLRDAVARYDRKGAVQAVRRLAGRLVVPTDLVPDPAGPQVPTSLSG